MSWESLGRTQYTYLNCASSGATNSASYADQNSPDIHAKPLVCTAVPMWQLLIVALHDDVAARTSNFFRASRMFILSAAVCKHP